MVNLIAQRDDLERFAPQIDPTNAPSANRRSPMLSTPSAKPSTGIGPGPPPDLPPSRVIKRNTHAMPQPSPQLPAAGPLVVARASNEYPRQTPDHRRMLVAMGAWFAYDGFIAWPRENQRIVELKSEIEAARKATTNPRSTSLTPRSALSSSTATPTCWCRRPWLPVYPAGLFVLGWSLYYSRGVTGLQNHILTVPGHPPIPSTPSARSIAPTGTARASPDQLRTGQPHHRQRLPGRLHLPAPTHRRHL